MGLWELLAPARANTAPSKADSILERHLVYCRRTGSLALSIRGGAHIFHSRSSAPLAKFQPQPTTEAAVRKAMWWSEEQLFKVVMDYIRAHHFSAGEAEWSCCRIYNECEQRIGKPLSPTYFKTSAAELTGRNDFLKVLGDEYSEQSVAEHLQRRYGVTQRQYLFEGPVGWLSVKYDPSQRQQFVAAIAPLFEEIEKQPGFICFEFDNESIAPRLSCWYHYTVIHSHFATGKRLTHCFFLDTNPNTNFKSLRLCLIT